MSRRYRLDTKVKALNLLDQFDGDMQLVEQELGIPASTLASWRRAEVDLRQRYYDRQQHHFYNVKFTLLARMLGSCEAIMERMDGEAIEGASLSQRASCIVLDYNGTVSKQQKDELWARYSTLAPQRRRQPAEQYKIVKRA